MSSCVLDASALLALFRDEPGGELVEMRIRNGGATISSVNQAEVGSKLLDLGYSSERMTAGIKDPNIEVVVFDEALALSSALLRLETRRLGLSLGDRACLATALTMGLPVLTADRTWEQVDAGVAVEVIR